VQDMILFSSPLVLFGRARKVNPFTSILMLDFIFRDFRANERRLVVLVRSPPPPFWTPRGYFSPGNPKGGFGDRRETL